jgi:hypothetical protein
MTLQKCHFCKPGKLCRWHRGYSKSSGVPGSSPGAIAYRKMKQRLSEEKA